MSVLQGARVVSKGVLKKDNSKIKDNLIHKSRDIECILTKKEVALATSLCYYLPHEDKCKP